MEGVVVLKEIIVRNMFVSDILTVSVAMLPFALAILVGTISMYKMRKTGKFKKHEMVLMVICLLLVFVGFPCAMIYSYNIYHYEYLVSVDDTVSFNDFMDHYSIVEENSIGYIVKEK